VSRLAGKAAVITGGTSGIGLETARLFAQEGARVAIIGRDEGRVRAAVGPNMLGLRADTTDPDSMAEAFRAANERFGGIDIVFANAGAAAATPLSLASLESFESLVRTNLTGTFVTLAAAQPYLNEGASLILTGSVMADLGPPGASAYAATKGAIRSMAKSLAGELAPRRIRVNIVAPGPVRTAIWTSERLKEIEPSVPLGRAGEAEEVARVALFLASDESSYITATEILVDGGSIGTPAGAPIYRA
jgi:NAD(P)-dependent dehydrogenase (short-subunit alcohol dehydrogenase family)